MNLGEESMNIMISLNKELENIKENQKKKKNVEIISNISWPQCYETGNQLWGKKLPKHKYMETKKCVAKQ